MPKLVTNKFQLNNAEQFLESFTEPTRNVYYAYAGQHVSFPNDSEPPDPDASENGLTYDTYDNMIFGKEIAPADVVQMTRRANWITDTVYTAYDHTDPLLNTKNFFVVSSESGSEHVFKCLGNAGGIPSTSQPLASQTSPAAESYFTADGYQWKFMYTISAANFLKFATTNHIPVYPNADVSANAVSGSIESVRVNDGGKNYNSHANGTFTAIAVSGDTLIYDITGSELSTNTGFYEESAAVIEVSGVKQLRQIADYNVTGGTKRITISSAFSPLPAVDDVIEITPNVVVFGDGSGATAKSVIDANNSVSSVEVITRGSGYTFGTATVTGNTGLVTNFTANTANVEAIISPVGGHGSDTNEELDAHFVGFSVEFSGNEGGNIPVDNDYRTVGVIQDPLLANVEVAIAHNDAPRVSDGEFIVDANTNAHGVITAIATGAANTTINVNNMFGKFAVGSGLKVGGTLALAQANSANIADTTSITNVVINNGVFDQRRAFNVTLVSGVPVEDEIFIQDSGLATESTAVLHTSNNTLAFFTDVKGIVASTDGSGSRFMDGLTSSARFEILATSISDLVDNTGEVIYTENNEPISRDAAQKETFKLVIEF